MRAHKARAKLIWDFGMRGTEQIEVRKLFFNLLFWFDCVVVVTGEVESKFYTYLAQAIKVWNMNFFKKFANKRQFVEICQL